MQLRLLHAIQTMDLATGGPVEGVRQLSRINQRRGHEVEVVSLDAPDARCVQQASIPVHAMGPGFTSYGYSSRYVNWLREHAAEYDCIIINGIWGFTALGAWLALRDLNVPYVVFTHGMLDPWFKYRYPFKHLKKWLYWPWGLYPLLREADAVLFTCNQERLLARESFWLYDCNEVVVKYGTAGLPDAEYDYRPAFLAAHPALVGFRLFLFLGRVHPKKGPDLLLKAVGQMKEAGTWDPHTMRLVMAGPAEGEYAEELQELAAKAGLTDSLYWTGMIAGDVKWGALQAAEAFLLPSHQENFGIAVAESLSAGVPVLISQAVNIAPEIGADGAGLVGEDTVAGCRAIFEQWLALPPEAQEAMRRQARQTFLSRYTADEAAMDLLKNIFLIIAARRTRPRRVS